LGQRENGDDKPPGGSSHALSLNGYSIALLDAAAIAMPVELTVITSELTNGGPEWESAPH
jgi:hypothetical protein